MNLRYSRCSVPLHCYLEDDSWPFSPLSRDNFQTGLEMKNATKIAVLVSRIPCNLFFFIICIRNQFIQL